MVNNEPSDETVEFYKSAVNDAVTQFSKNTTQTPTLYENNKFYYRNLFNFMNYMQKYKKEIYTPDFMDYIIGGRQLENDQYSS